MTDSFKVGDHVFIGEPTPQKIHWEIVEHYGPFVNLRSPMSGHRRRALVSELTLHTKGSPA